MFQLCNVLVFDAEYQGEREIETMRSTPVLMNEHVPRNRGKSRTYCCTHEITWLTVRMKLCLVTKVTFGWYSKNIKQVNFVTSPFP